MVPSLTAITAEARQRLEALQRFSTLGAGFQLASTDLEIRGTGDLLGGKQSGNIASVGFEEYMRIMEEAIAELRGEPLQAESDPDLTSDVPSFIPDDHVSDPGMRLHFYRRFASLGSESEADALLAELADRFGPAPDEVHKLAGLMVLKAFARRLRARSVDLSGRKLTLALDERTPLAPAVVRDLVLARGSLYTLTPDLRLVRRLERTGDLERLLEAKKALHELARHVREGAG
jgi:transcription-repair coupling factor (superfamily II helicase)